MAKKAIIKKKGGKPVITEREASRMVAEAGAAAYAQSGSAEGDPKVVEALTTSHLVFDIAGLKVRPMSLENFILLEKVWKSKAHIEATGSLKQAMTLFAYADPEGAAKSLRTSEGHFERATSEWAARVPINALRELAALVTGHLNDYYGISAGEPSKKKTLKPLRAGLRR